VIIVRNVTDGVMLSETPLSVEKVADVFPEILLSAYHCLSSEALRVTLSASCVALDVWHL
jgi:hypothetical protein